MKISVVFGFIVGSWRYELLRLHFADGLGNEFQLSRHRDYFWK